jgi:hypothetical protein
MIPRCGEEPARPDAFLFRYFRIRYLQALENPPTPTIAFGPE